MWKCTSCKMENDDSFSFCCKCGAAIQNEPKNPVKGPGSEYWQCSCGYKNNSDFAYCSHCGKPRPTPDPQSDWKCVKCGYNNKSDSTYCADCGTPKYVEKHGVSAKLLILALGVATAVLLVVVGILIYGNIKQDSAATHNSSPTSYSNTSTNNASQSNLPTQKPTSVPTPEPIPTPTSVPTPEPIIQCSTIVTEISRENRDWQHYFLGSKLNYNVFKTGEVENSYAFHMEYSCKVTNPECGKDATGTRIVYVRDKVNEQANNDSAWIEVGRFSYNSASGSVMPVDINWDDTLGPLDVYSMAIYLDKNMSGASYSASWGDSITLYSYEYY